VAGAGVEMDVQQTKSGPRLMMALAARPRSQR